MLKKQLDFLNFLKHNHLRMNLESKYITQTIIEVSNNQFFKIIIILLIALFLQSLTPILANTISKFFIKNNSDDIERNKNIKTIAHLFNTTFVIIIWIGALISILHTFNVKLGPLLTGAGILGAIIGFGSQNVIKDILAGIFILAEHQYRVGDYVTFYPSGKKIFGRVETMTLRVTKLRDISGRLHIVRNAASSAITNHTFEYSKINLDLNVDYDSDIDLVEKVINDIGQKIYNNPTWHDLIIEPIHFLRIKKLDEYSIVVKVIGKVKVGSKFAITGEIKRQVLKEFAKNNINIPYPQIVIKKD